MTPRTGRSRGGRTALGLIAVFAMAASVTSCTQDQRGVIVVLAPRDDSVGGQRQLLVDRWNFTNPDTPATIVELSGRADQQHTSLVVDAQDEQSDVDVYGLDVTWTTEFADNEWIQPVSPLDGQARADFLSGPVATATEGGKLYGRPYNTDAGLLYYRRDIFPGRPPESWADLADAAPRLAVAPAPRPTAVYATQLAPYEGLVVNVLETMRSRTPDEGEFDFFAAGLPALQRAVRQLRTSPGEVPPLVLPASLTFDEDASLQAFRQGRVAVIRNWPVAARTLLTPSVEDPSAAQRIGVTQLFGDGTILGGQNLAVSKHSDQAESAERFITFLTGREAELQLFDAGGVAPTRRSAYDLSVRAGDELTKQIKNAVASAVPRPTGACYGAFSALLSSIVHEALVSGDPLPDDLMSRLERALDCKPLR